MRQESSQPALAEPVASDAARLMPAPPRWLLAVPDAIRQLEKLDRDLLTRREMRSTGITVGFILAGAILCLPSLSYAQALSEEEAWRQVAEALAAAGRVSRQLDTDRHQRPSARLRRSDRAALQSRSRECARDARAVGTSSTVRGVDFVR